MCYIRNTLSIVFCFVRTGGKVFDRDGILTVFNVTDPFKREAI